MELKGEKVVVIGGSSGIGLAVARAALAEGAKVLIASRSREKLARAKAELGGQAAAVSLDITDYAAVEKFFERIGSIDHLVTTASGSLAGKFLELDMDEVRRLFDSKFWGQYRAAQCARRQMQETGSITFFSGIAGSKALPGLSSYAAVNGAINSLCRPLALELAPVRVNVVSPGLIETPAYENMPEEDRQLFFDRLAGKVPARRIGQPEDVARGVIYLMKSGYSTGTVLEIDGGHHLI